MRTFLHSTFSPSDKSWLNFDREKIRQRVMMARAIQRGTELHELAKHCIDMRTPLDSSNGIISKYVKDCIELGMETEVTLTYSQALRMQFDTILYPTPYMYSILRPEIERPAFSKLFSMLHYGAVHVITSPCL